MFKILTTLVIFLLSLHLSAAPQAVKNDSPRIVIEPDQTDIYAIPLDEDAQDQQEELEELEHPNHRD